MECGVTRRPGCLNTRCDWCVEWVIDCAADSFQMPALRRSCPRSNWKLGPLPIVPLSNVAPPQADSEEKHKVINLASYIRSDLFNTV